MILLSKICQVPLYVILTGGLKGIRVIFPEVLLNPIISDSFGFSARNCTLFFLLLFSTTPIINSSLL